MKQIGFPFLTACLLVGCQKNDTATPVKVPLADVKK